ncbi:MAG: ATP-binding protein [Armatimonadia bacterium]
MPDLLVMLRSTFNKAGEFDERFRWLREVDLLVIDDLGTESQSPWGVEKLYQIVNFRYTQRLPLVVTSNVPLAQAGNRIEPRIVSRLMEGARSREGWSRELVIPAGDYRPTAQEG